CRSPPRSARRARPALRASRDDRGPSRVQRGGSRRGCRSRARAARPSPSAKSSSSLLPYGVTLIARGSRASTSSSGRRLGSRDLFFGVTQRPEDQVALRVGRSREERPAKERIDVLPDNLSLPGDLEEPAEGRLAEQRVAVGQALSVAHARRE